MPSLSCASSQSVLPSGRPIWGPRAIMVRKPPAVLFLDWSSFSCLLSFLRSASITRCLRWRAKSPTQTTSISLSEKPRGLMLRIFWYVSHPHGPNSTLQIKTKTKKIFLIHIDSSRNASLIRKKKIVLLFFLELSLVYHFRKLWHWSKLLTVL